MFAMVVTSCTCAMNDRRECGGFLGDEDERTGIATVGDATVAADAAGWKRGMVEVAEMAEKYADSLEEHGATQGPKYLDALARSIREKVGGG